MSVVLLLIGIGAICALLYYAAVYALPLFVGFTAGFWALNHGAGAGSVVIGLMAGAAVFLAGQLALTSRFATLQWLVILVFVVPAAYAGYSMVLQVAGSDVAPGD